MKKNLVWLSFCIAALTTLTACEMHIDSSSSTNKIMGSGKIITEQRPVTAFNAIENNSFFSVIVTGSDKDEVEIIEEDPTL